VFLVLQSRQNGKAYAGVHLLILPGAAPGKRTPLPAN
jgi:hypothetical protein